MNVTRPSCGRPRHGVRYNRPPGYRASHPLQTGGHCGMRRTTRALGALLLGQLLAPAAPAAAQETLPPAGPTSPDRPVLELSLDEAVKRAFEGNADILVEQY